MDRHPRRRPRRASLYRLRPRSRRTPAVAVRATTPVAAPGPRRLSRRRVVVALLLSAGFALSGSTGAVAYFLPAIRTALAATGQTSGLPADPSLPPGATPRAAPTSNDPFTVLLMGSDNDAKFQTGALLTQSMILVRVIPATKQVTLLSIPRDLYVPISTGGSGKIMSAYSHGGPPPAIATVEKNFGVHIDHYVWIGLQGLVSLIDQLGGVDVVTTNPVLDDFYPADLSGGNPYDFQRVAIMPGAQHMNGITAMEYVRSRHGDIHEDFGRSVRQQQVLLALRSKASKLGLADLPEVSSSLNGELTTDIGLGQVSSLLPLASGLDLGNVQRVTLMPPYTANATIDGQDVLIPNWDLIRPLVAKTFPG